MYRDKKEKRINSRGSISLFVALSMMLVAQFVFGMLELGRGIEIDKVAQMNTARVVESMFATYDPDLWERYGLLGFEGEDSEEIMKYLTAKNHGEGILAMELWDISYTNYTLLTDSEGTVFIEAISEYMEESVALGTIDFIKDQFDELQDIENTDVSGEDSKEIIQDAITDIENEEGLVSNVSREDNPLYTVNNAQKTGILELVLEDTSEVSKGVVSVEQAVSHRELCQGINPESPDIGLYEKIMFEQYLIRNFSSYVNQKENHSMKYELEYLLFGKESDMENLRSVVGRLLWIREAANMAYLLTDSSKQSEAMTLATAIAGVSANPAIIEAVKWGILASWAYCESVLDVRALLQGKKIAIIKNSNEWTSDLGGIAGCLDGFCVAEESQSGLNYEDYLGFFLLTGKNDKLAYRAMDMMEVTISTIEGKGNFQIDHLVYSMKGKCDYQYSYLFSNLVSLASLDASSRTVSTTFSYSYKDE